MLESPKRVSGTGGLEYRNQANNMVSKSINPGTRRPSTNSPVPILTKSINGNVFKRNSAPKPDQSLTSVGSSFRIPHISTTGRNAAEAYY